MAIDSTSLPPSTFNYGLGQAQGLGEVGKVTSDKVSGGHKEAVHTPDVKTSQNEMESLKFAPKSKLAKSGGESGGSDVGGLAAFMAEPSFGDLGAEVAKLMTKQLGLQAKQAIQQQLDLGQAARSQDIASAHTLESQAAEMKTNAIVSLAVGLAGTAAQGVGTAMSAFKELQAVSKESKALAPMTKDEIAIEKQMSSTLGKELGEGAKVGGKVASAATKAEQTVEKAEQQVAKEAQEAEKASEKFTDKLSKFFSKDSSADAAKASKQAKFAEEVKGDNRSMEEVRLSLLGHKETMQESKQLSSSAARWDAVGKMANTTAETVSKFVSSNTEADMKLKDAEMKMNDANKDLLSSQAEMLKTTAQNLSNTIGQVIEFEKAMVDSKAEQFKAIVG